MRHILRFLRWSGRVALVSYFVIGVAWLGVRYALLPQVDQWRGAIAQQLSQTLGVQVSVGAIDAEWLGLRPRLTFRAVSMEDTRRGERLDLPYLHATLGWRSLVARRLQFTRLEVAGLDVTVRRDDAGGVWILDQALGRAGALDATAPTSTSDALDAGSTDAGASVPVPVPVPVPTSTVPATLSATVAWLLSQPHIDLTDVTLRWLDAQRQAPPLVLHRARLALRNYGDVHQVALAVSTPASLAGALEVRAEFQLDDVASMDVSRLHGRVYVRADALHPAAWRPWLDIPAAWRDGQLWAQTSATVDAGRLDAVALDLRVRQGRWQWAKNDQLGLDAARLYIEGAWSALAQFAALPDALGISEPVARNVDVADREGSPRTNRGLRHSDDEDVQHGEPPETAHACSAGACSEEPLRIHMQVAGLRTRLPSLFDEALQVDALTLAGQLDAQDGAPRLVLDAVTAVNADMDVTWRGEWRAAPDLEAGMVDWHGRFKRLAIPAIQRYLPKVVSADARAWMRVGLLGGHIQDADFFLRGDLMQFPFGDAPGRGDFSLRGRVVDGVIDYAATASGSLPWPRLDAIQGRVDMRRVTLALQADRATMSPAHDLVPIVLTQLSANIPNIERDPQLTVQGQTRAPAASYLGLMRHSPLGERLDHVFAESSGSGAWQVPLTLVVPLLHSLDLTVDGQVQFADGTLQLMPEMPPFEGLQGTVAFTHEVITAPELSGRFLGDAVTIRGGIGAQQSGLQFAGRVTSDALRDYVGVQGMDRLQGGAAYTALLARAPSSGFQLHVQSDLRGMALALPAPLKKSADQALALQARWGDAADANTGNARNTTARQQALDVQLGDDVQLRLLRRPDTAEGPYFYAGALVMHWFIPGTLAPGMQVDVRMPAGDASAWRRVVDSFSQPLSPHAAAPRQLLPDLRDLRVQTDRLHLFGLEMDAATLHAVRQDAQHWQIDVRSAQTEGALLWRTASADAEGHVQARFDRLAIGRRYDGADTGDVENAKDAEDAEPTAAPDDADAARQDIVIQDALDIPTLELYARQFTLYDYPLGELSLTGVQQPDAWALESLRIAGAGMSMEGRGLWHLRGAQRGLNLDVLATVADMGAYLTQLGVDGVLRQGQGSVQGQFFWRDLPWRLDLANLHGTLSVSLDKGRFSRVSSRTARLLELLSIQSLQRLARLDWNLDALVRDGFPFDALRGDIALEDGKLHTQDYRVIGPVGTIVIGGAVDLQAQRQTLQAAVIPNLDMSGAALAAGFAINPVVGVGAFLTQWLLKRPMENAMALEYRIEGSWDEPDIEEIARRTPQEDTTAVLP